MKNDKLSDQFLINDQIRAREVRVVGDDIEPKVVSLREALRIADEMELDLVEISPNAVPPVCRVVDYSKFLYQLKKKQKEAKAKQVKIDVKEIRFGPQTDDHDYNFKLKHAIGFLQDGDKFKILPKILTARVVSVNEKRVLNKPIERKIKESIRYKRLMEKYSFTGTQVADGNVIEANIVAILNATLQYNEFGNPNNGQEIVMDATEICDEYLKYLEIL